MHWRKSSVKLNSLFVFFVLFNLKITRFSTIFICHCTCIRKVCSLHFNLSRNFCCLNHYSVGTSYSSDNIWFHKKTSLSCVLLLMRSLQHVLTWFSGCKSTMIPKEQDFLEGGGSPLDFSSGLLLALTVGIWFYPSSCLLQSVYCTLENAPSNEYHEACWWFIIGIDLKISN